MHIFEDLPTVVKIFVILFLLISVPAIFYTFSKCGMETFLYGNGSTYAAVSGACD